MGNWQAKKLGEVINLKRGYDLPKKDRIDGEIPIVSSSGITGYHNEAKVEAPGVVTGRYGTLGEVFYLEEDFWPLNTSLYVQNFRGNDERFISYFLKTLPFADQNVAGAVPGVNRNYLHKLEVEIPDHSTQQKIASILSAFDDLIENNTRRIEILEEMARLIYREWFVHYRYPGHENDKLVDSGTDLGEIPEGWKVKELGQIVDINKGKNITKKTANTDGAIPVVAGGLEPAYMHDKPNTKHPVITVSASGANAGYVNLYELDVWASDCSYIDMEATDEVYFYYSLMKDRQDDIFHMQHGSAQPHVYPKDLNRLEIAYPAQDLIQEFLSEVTSIFSQIKTLGKQNDRLKETRDLLLPKLISGKVGV